MDIQLEICLKQVNRLEYCLYSIRFICIINVNTNDGSLLTRGSIGNFGVLNLNSIIVMFYKKGEEF